MFTSDKIIDFINRENKEVLPKIYFNYYVKFDIDDNKKIVIVNEDYIEEVYGIHKRFIKESNTYILEERLINFNDVEEVIPNLKGIIEEELIENLVNKYKDIFCCEPKVGRRKSTFSKYNDIKISKLSTKLHSDLSKYYLKTESSFKQNKV